MLQHGVALPQPRQYGERTTRSLRAAWRTHVVVLRFCSKNGHVAGVSDLSVCLAKVLLRIQRVKPQSGTRAVDEHSAVVWLLKQQLQRDKTMSEKRARKDADKRPVTSPEDEMSGSTVPDATTVPKPVCAASLPSAAFQAAGSGRTWRRGGVGRVQQPKSRLKS